MSLDANMILYQIYPRPEKEVAESNRATNRDLKRTQQLSSENV